ncbi:MAG TPA: L,D-transpeptidase family protein [Terriglobales bacterium]|nr:L,D-transpeptidase family protein [Terriglobales bacterium]
MRVTLTAIVLLATCLCAVAEDSAVDVDRVVVYKSQRKLVLLAHGKELKTYRVALGGQPIGAKTRQGDHRTPEGSYVLDARNPNSQYYKSFHISYPNANDRAQARKLGVSPGGDIMLHGLPKAYAWVGKERTLHDWTDGCVAVTNQEMDELWNLIRIGTPIDIKP